MKENKLLNRLDDLAIRFEEIATLITDPNVISDQKRFVRLTKEYKELEDIMNIRTEYMQHLSNIEEGKLILENEKDHDLREMAKEEMDSSQAILPELEEKIKILLIPEDPEDEKNAIVEISNLKTMFIGNGIGYSTLTQDPHNFYLFHSLTTFYLK